MEYIAGVRYADSHISSKQNENLKSLSISHRYGSRDEQGSLYWMYFAYDTTGVLRIWVEQTGPSQEWSDCSKEKTTKDHSEARETQKKPASCRKARRLTRPQIPPRRSQQY